MNEEKQARISPWKTLQGQEKDTHERGARGKGGEALHCATLTMAESETVTAADLESYRVQCAEFEKESERTIAHAAVEKQAESLGLKWNGADYATA